MRQRATISDPGKQTTIHNKQLYNDVATMMLGQGLFRQNTADN